MLYQLPNGKTIYITVEECLNMTKDEEQFLLMYGYGESINNPFVQSVIHKKGNRDNYDSDDDIYEEDEVSLDGVDIDLLDESVDFPEDLMGSDFSD